MRQGKRGGGIYRKGVTEEKKLNKNADTHTHLQGFCKHFVHFSRVKLLHGKIYDSANSSLSLSADCLNWSADMVIRQMCLSVFLSNI